MADKQQLSPASGTLSLLGKVVPTINFYRRLKQDFNLSFLYELVAPSYGKCGHQSIDPVLFRSGDPVQADVGQASRKSFF